MFNFSFKSWVLYNKKCLTRRAKSKGLWSQTHNNFNVKMIDELCIQELN